MVLPRDPCLNVDFEFLKSGPETDLSINLSRRADERLREFQAEILGSGSPPMVAFGARLVSLETESAAAKVSLSPILAGTWEKRETPGGRSLAAGR